MKKLLFLPIIISLAFSFLSCSSEDDNNETSASVTPISTDVNKEEFTKSKAYTKDFTLDLSSNPLTDTAFNALKNGSVDAATYFRQSCVTASSASASRAATGSGSTDAGLDDFEVTLDKNISTPTKIVVQIKAKTPDSDCTVLITAFIPAKDTEKKESYVSLVTQVKVGEGGGSASNASLNISSLTVPTKNELKGLILTCTDDDGETNYLKFDSEGKTVILYEKGADSSTCKIVAEYSYVESTGSLKSSKTYELDLGFKKHLVKYDGNFYLYEIKLNRESGEGLDSTFSMESEVEESVMGEKEDGSYTEMTKATVNCEMKMITTSTLTFTGEFKISGSARMSDEYITEMKKQLEEMKKQLEEIKEKDPDLYKEMMAKLEAELETMSQGLKIEQ
ncbi:MAG: hypothetical protein K5873_07180, partial [Treponema sp.]|nr:hypothetical protein [Treponema sp.]